MERSLVLAGGCFWCVESDLRHLDGVLDVVSGYSGDSAESANYSAVCSNSTLHREVILVTYDDSVVSFRDVVEFFLDKIDVTDVDGQFADRGRQYQPVVYYESEDERLLSVEVLNALTESGMYDKPVVVLVEPRVEFYPAEENHQRYAEKNPTHYHMYKVGSGRLSHQQRVCELRKKYK